MMRQVQENVDAEMVSIPIFYYFLKQNIYNEIKILWGY